MPLNSTVTLGILATLTASPSELADASTALNKSYGASLSSGVAAGSADVLWHDQRTIAPSANDDLDLAGVLAGLLGGTATFVKVKGLVIAALGAPGPPAVPNVNNVVVGAAAANAWTALLGATHTIQVRPGAAIALLPSATDTGYPVVPATGDILRIANGGAGTSVTYDIILIGTSA